MEENEHMRRPACIDEAERRCVFLTHAPTKMMQSGHDTLLYFTLRTDEDEAERIQHPVIFYLED